MRAASRWALVLFACAAPLLAHAAAPARAWTSRVTAPSGDALSPPTGIFRSHEIALDSNGDVVLPIAQEAPGRAPCALVAMVSGGSGQAAWRDEICNAEAEAVANAPGGGVFVGITTGGYFGLSSFEVEVPRDCAAHRGVFDSGHAVMGLAAARGRLHFLGERRSPPPTVMSMSQAQVDSFCGSRNSSQDLLIVRLAGDTGAVRWERRINGKNNGDDYVGDLAFTPTAQGRLALFACAGRYEQRLHDWNLLLLSAADGTTLWEKDVDGGRDDSREASSRSMETAT